MEPLDSVILGAGAAGLFCAGRLAQAGQRVIVLDHAKKPAEKVRISGGGRCNFTHLNTGPQCFLSSNPHFAKSALARYTPRDFCDLMTAHGLTWQEKTEGQLFCDQRSAAVIDLLLTEAAGAEIRLDCSVDAVTKTAEGFLIETAGGPLAARSVVVATGGLSIPKMGATGFAYRLAERFGHDIVETRPGLVPFTLTGERKDRVASCAGVSTDVVAEAGGMAFRDALLLTHRGLSGPALLQISSYWQPGEAIALDLLGPVTKEDGPLLVAKRAAPKRSLASTLGEHLPDRLVALLTTEFALPAKSRLGDLPDRRLGEIEGHLRQWSITPAGTEGYRTAEVTIGGIATDGLSSRTMESRHCPGAYFIGECVDVTGWLGGHNFQWAWASAAAAAEAIIMA